MASTYKTPGVYVEEISLFPPSVAQVETSVPAFIGYTQIAKDADGIDLKNIPTKIYSLKEFETYFGFAENEKKIIVQVNQKKDASGAVTEISSAVASMGTITAPVAPALTPTIAAAAGSKHNMYYSMRIYFDNGGGPCYIVSVGDYTTADPSDTDLQKGLDALAYYDEPTIIVFPEGQTVDEAKYYTLISKAIDQSAKLQDRFTLVDINTTKSTTDATVSNFRTKFSKIDSLSYAAAYYPNLKTTYDYTYADTDVNVSITTSTTAADGTVTTATAAAVKLSTFLETTTLQKAVYNVAKQAIQKLSPALPPSPAMAGIYCKIDDARGVWKAPANVALAGVYDVTDNVDDAHQGTMNIDTEAGKSVNAIRPFTGKGILVWGARTLDGNSNEWRYISVRRFFNMVEESVKKSSGQFVFEPNDANTWTKVKGMIENYLINLWRQGALAGAKPEHSFFVKIGLGQTMTAQDVLNGFMTIEIGMAVVRPAEFIILKFSHKMQES